MRSADPGTEVHFDWRRSPLLQGVGERFRRGGVDEHKRVEEI